MADPRQQPNQGSAANVRELHRLVWKALGMASMNYKKDSGTYIERLFDAFEFYGIEVRRVR